MKPFALPFSRQQVGRAWRTLTYFWRRLGEERVAEAAAGMAFYSFFSLFPTLVLLVVAAAALLENTQEQILSHLTEVFPFAGEVIESSIQQVLRARGPVSLWSALALAWSGSGVFNNLVRNVNRAWPQAEVRPYYVQRLMAMLILLLLLLLSALLLLINTVTHLLPAVIQGVMNSVLAGMRALTSLAILLQVFVTLFWLYRWLPNTRVSWTAGFWGALFTTLATAGVTRLFTWYVRAGFANYSLVYGSLGAVAALLFWIYLLAYIVLAGAHICALWQQPTADRDYGQR